MDSKQNLDIESIVSNVYIYGCATSIIASGYPMAKEVSKEDMDDRVITEQDKRRAIRLASVASGSGHDCFLKGITVQFDLTFSKHTWLEALRYHWFDVISSQSTMHCLSTMKIKYMPWTDKSVIDAFQQVLDRYIAESTEENWLAMIYSYPVGLQLTARMSTNLLQLKTIYKQRNNHRIPEWRVFCQFIQGVFEYCRLERAIYDEA